jgi:hypothetical protein
MSQQGMENKLQKYLRKIDQVDRQYIRQSWTTKTCPPGMRDNDRVKHLNMSRQYTRCKRLGLERK